jgi:hypothetical protein
MTEERLTHASVGLTMLVVIGAYAVCLPPGVAWWDTAEAQTVPYVAGIFHPTGFPAYAIAGWLFTHLFAFGNVAWRMSLFSALAGAGAAALFIPAAKRLGASTAAATIGALAFAFTPIASQHATRAGVNSFALLIAVAAIGAALGAGLTWAAFFAGLSLAVHPVNVWLLPGTLLIALAARPPAAARLRIAFASAAAFAGGLSFYLYLPIRSAIATATHVDPTADLPIAYHPIWDYDHPSTVAGFVRLVSGADFHASGTLAAIAHLGAYPGYALAFATTVAGQYSLVGALLVIGGMIALRGRPLIALGLAAAAFGVFPFSASYDMLTDPTKYYLAALWVTGLLAAVGASAYGGRFVRSIPLLLLAGIVALDMRHAPNVFDQRTDVSARSIIVSVQTATPDDAIIATPWWYATPLYYAAFVERSLGHRRIVTNVGHTEIAELAAGHRLYYFPIPADDIDIAGTTVTRVPGTSPEMFEVRPIVKGAFTRPRARRVRLEEVRALGLRHDHPRLVEVRPRMREHERGDVGRFLIGERPLAAERHVRFDERGHLGIHPRTVVERRWTPERRKFRGGITRAVGTVTHRALGGVDLRTGSRIGRIRRVHGHEALIGEAFADFGAAREPRDVGRHRDHLAAVGRGRRPVHAVEKAFGETVLQRDEAAGALIPLRKRRIDAEKRTAVRLRAGVDVTGRAGHAGFDVRRGERRRIGDERAPVPDQIAFRPLRDRGTRRGGGGIAERRGRGGRAGRRHETGDRNRGNRQTGHERSFHAPSRKKATMDPAVRAGQKQPFVGFDQELLCEQFVVHRDRAVDLKAKRRLIRADVERFVG